MSLFNEIAKLPLDKESVLITAINGGEVFHYILMENEVIYTDSKEKPDFNKLKELAFGYTEIDGVKYFSDCLRHEAKLVVCGGGYVSQALIRVARLLDFKIIALEDRLNFAQALKNAGADEVLYDSFDTSLDSIEGDLDTYFAIITRGHRYDTLCLERILKKSHAYIGMISSKFRAATTKKAMIKEGFAKALVESIYSPIGLKIGGQTPEEIGVSIAAELIAVKNKNKWSGGFNTELIEAVNNSKLKAVLATIMTRKGSSPRDIGTKMVIFEDGSTAGTIGGGCAEADIRTQARHVLREGKSRFYHIDMTESNINEEEGMICGGVMDVFLEEIGRD